MSLPRNLLDAVLERLGFSGHPEPTPEGLAEIYAAWCARIPFDNVRKLIHVRSGSPAPFPGGTAQDFFEGWLEHGTGGTCWANAGATHALLEALDFDTARGIGTMLAVPDIPPNHGTVLVRFGARRFLVDGSMLHGEPLPLGDESGISHPAWGVRHESGLVSWRPLHKTDGFACRLEHFDAKGEDFLHGYEITRQWSPFNYEVYARRNRGDEVIGVAFGRKITLYGDGSVDSEPLEPGARNHFLVESFGLSEEIVAQIPPDLKTPPPPDSRAARG